MASDSPESPNKRKRQHNGPRRDHPLFASRRSGTPSQQPPDFLTESLNTTYIPSPSPSKSPTRQGYQAKPRQILERRSLAASLHASSNFEKENYRPGSQRYAVEPPLRKSSPLRFNSHARSALPLATSRSPVRTRTPTPTRTRGRQCSLDSPAHSESSPPRGYAEAYQRINEEENLASEESIDNADDEDFDVIHNDVSQEVDELKEERRNPSLSPVSLRTSRKPSPKVSKTSLVSDGMEAKNGESGVGDSVSDPGRAEDSTESSIGSGSSQYARDLHRLNSALKSGNKAFSKARLGERKGLSIDNLKRRNGSNESLGSAFSAGSLGTDPSVNIPKAWGRKAKPGKDWLSRINGRNSEGAHDGLKKVSAPNKPHPGNETEENWTTTASEVPLPQSSPLNESPIVPTPKTALQSGIANEPNQETWELQEEEFTGRSLQASESPPIRLQHAKLETVRVEDNDSPERRRPTEDQYQKLEENSESTQAARKSSGQLLLPERMAKEEQDEAQDAQPLETNENRLTVEELGQPIPDTPVVIYQSRTDPKEQDRGYRGTDIRRPEKRRHESHDLLKRLSRATSDSPSPERIASLPEQLPNQDHTWENFEPSQIPLQTPVITGAWVDQTIEPSPEKETRLATLKTPLVTGAWVDTPHTAGTRKTPPTTSNVDGEEGGNKTVTRATTTTQSLAPAYSRRSRILDHEKILKYSGPPLPKSALEQIVKDAKSGKFIKNKEPRQQQSDSEDDPTLLLGNSTIASLEDLVENDTDRSTLLAPTPPSQETSPPSSDPSPSSKSKSSHSKQREESDVDPDKYSSLLSRLTNLGPSLRASKRQIASLERTVSSSGSATITRARSGTSTDDLEGDEECNEAGPLHDFLWPCARCGCPGSGNNAIPRPDTSYSFQMPALFSFTSYHFAPSVTTASAPTAAITSTLATYTPTIFSQGPSSSSAISPIVTTLTIPIPRLFYFPPNSRIPRPTRLGAILLTIYFYFFFEIWAQDTFCHQEWASSMEGYGVDINAPEPPFVMFKMLYRWLRMADVMHPAYILVRTVWRLIRMLVVYVVGVLMEGAGLGGAGGMGFTGNGNKNGVGGLGETLAAAATRQPISQDTRIPRPEWGPDLSLLDDEFL